MERSNQATYEREPLKLSVRRPMFQREEPKPEARIEIDEDGALIFTPKDEGFLEAFKALVPWNDRSWNVSSLSWFCASRHVDNVQALLTLFFNPVEVKDYREEGQPAWRVREALSNERQHREDTRFENEMAALEMQLEMEEAGDR